MCRILASLPGLVLLAGCTGGAVDPFAGVDARLHVLERHRASANSGTHRAETISRVRCGSGEYNGDSFYLTSHPTLEVADGNTLTLRPTAGAMFAQDTSTSWADESTVDTTVRQSSRRRAPLPGFWDTVKRDLRSMPADLWDDTKAVYGSAPNLIILGLTYGGCLAVQETGPDDTVEDSYRHHSTFSKDARDIFGAAGNPGTHFALAGAWYLLGQQRQDEKTYEVGRTLFSALIINGLSTLAGKAASWDRSPNGELGAFPSGHTSSTFTVAAVMHDAYGPLVGVPLYGLGVLVAMERLEDGEHYLSDVIMGGVMGLVIGHTVAGEHKFEVFGGEILPYADPHTGSSGIAWVTHFK